jgi:transposase
VGGCCAADSAAAAWRWQAPHRHAAVVDGLMYILSTGCQWRYLPKDFPPRSTVYNYFVWWQCDRVLDRIHHALYIECRERAEREASPTAAIIDSQSVKSAEKGGPASTRTGSMPAS